MFDFRKRRSIDIPLHDEFNADPCTYVLGDNNDTLVTSAGVQIVGLNGSSSSRQPVQKSLRFWYDNCTAHLCRVIRLLMKVLLNHGDAGGIRRREQYAEG
jgi:hypothetical protein